MKLIYADNASTTRISNYAYEKMLPFLREQYGNASSQYSLGVDARRAIKHAREQIASVINATPDEVLFTSGGTEANSWVLDKIVEGCYDANIHVITSSIEHPSVYNTCRAIETKGYPVTYLPVDASGLVSLESVVAAITPTTRLVSIMLANNEIGTIQPIVEIGKLLKERGILFHTDAVQAAGHIDVDVHDLRVDFLTASAHKFNGAKGTGILYSRSGVDLPPLIHGGGQERLLRSGTENVASIVAAGYALEESVADMKESAKRLRSMVDDTVSYIQSTIPNVRINGCYEKRLPGIINIGFDGVSGESLMHLLDLKGICVSTSSACNAGKDEPSHVLLALGQTEQQAKSAIRISYGMNNTVEDVRAIADAICYAYDKIIFK
jgi:cysteine desulfurase